MYALPVFMYAYIHIYSDHQNSHDENRKRNDFKFTKYCLKSELNGGLYLSTERKSRWKKAEKEKRKKTTGTILLFMYI